MKCKNTLLGILASSGVLLSCENAEKAQTSSYNRNNRQIEFQNPYKTDKEIFEAVIGNPFYINIDSSKKDK
jgi:uncharacterized lipoprotein YehR (DUF1307 family)